VEDDVTEERMLTVKQIAESLQVHPETVRGWLTRSGGRRTVRLEIGGDVLELTGTTSAVQERLVDEWIRAHATVEEPR